MTYEIALLGTELEQASAQAYMYAGLWVANCVDVMCPAVILAEDSGPSQRLNIDCPECGSRARVIWPDAEIFEEINRLMCLRPYKLSRNWAPAWHRQAILSEGGKWMMGQSVEELAQENLDHGVGV